MIHVLSVGGSIIAPAQPDMEFLSAFSQMARGWISDDSSHKLILVIGGGAPARVYQNAYRSVCGDCDNEQADWIGVMATRLNAQLVRAVFSDLCGQPVVYDPTAPVEFSGRVLIAAGWKPGFSSDNDAVILAERFGAKTVVNLSNIAKVYTDDPRTNPDAKPLDTVSWADFRRMVGDEWTPGKNVPFDPVASRRAEAAGITVICAAGKDIENTRRILNNEPFTGTTIA
ncbi:MAG TPA: UMP kinase [Candidatus Treponema faecavium]|nr:UMP kinase [Candidatus Treponema faecavium]